MTRLIVALFIITVLVVVLGGDCSLPFVFATGVNKEIYS